MKDNSIFRALKWKNIGPYFMGGRVTDIEGVDNNPAKFYVATASGGLWVTENNATTWTPIFDFESSITIGDIAISQTDEQLIWVGTGEQNSSRSSYAGTGIFKSIDGGKTWNNMGLTDSHHISRVIIDPKDNNVVYVAVLGHLYTENEKRGLYKTADGGKTWTRVLYIDSRTGIIDVVMKPGDSSVLYAASWERERKAWNFVEGGEGSAIFKSTDAGKTWKKIVDGFPQNKFVGRIGLAVSPAKPGAVYAYLDNQEPRPEEKKEDAKTKGDKKKGKKNKKKKEKDANKNLFNTDIKGAEVYRSDDGGETWIKANEKYLDKVVFTYGYYFGQVRVDPVNADIVYITGVPLLQSKDGGKTFKPIAGIRGFTGSSNVHSDMQALWIDPQNTKRIILGNDGGVNITYDQGKTWQKINNISLAQCYTVNYDMNKPYRIYTGLQDNGVNVGYSNFRLGSRTNTWRSILGGDGAFVCPDPLDKNKAYAAYQFGYMYHVDMKDRNKVKFIRPKSPDKEHPYRFNWLSPFFVSQHNPYTLYIGCNTVLRSIDRGKNWEEISPDLSDCQNTNGDVPYAMVVSLDESPMKSGLLYAGTDDGNVWVKKDALSQWSKINKGLPKKWVTRIVASKYKKERVYLTMTGYRDDDFNTYVYASEDFGTTWTPIKGNLPEEALNVIREDPVNENILYLGTDLGIYVTLDRGSTWFSLKNNLPTNAVYDLRVHPREKDLIIGTHGRGVYLMNVEHIQALTAEILEKPLHILQLEDVKLLQRRFASYQGPMEVTFYANAEADIPAVLQADSRKKRKKIISFKIKANKGINTWKWDLILDAKTKKRIEKGDYTFIIGKGKTTVRKKVKIK